MHEPIQDRGGHRGVAQVRAPVLDNAIGGHRQAAALALVAQGLGVAIVNPMTAAACAGPAMVVRPLTVRIPYKVTLLTPLHRPTHRLAAPLTEALRARLRSMTS